jgi:hypothetical protein
MRYQRIVAVEVVNSLFFDDLGAASDEVRTV